MTIQGHIVSYDLHTRFGVLADTSGKQHRFPATEWLGHSAPVGGQPVTFDIAHGLVVNVTPLAHTSSGSSFSARPAAAQITPALAMGDVPPTFWQFYFSPVGRVSRGQYWHRYVLWAGGSFGLLLSIPWLAYWFLGSYFHWPQTIMLFGKGLSLIDTLLFGWISFVMHQKRFHDLGRNLGGAWSILDENVPMSMGNSGVWGRGWDLLFTEGDMGPNQYGPDPREFDA